ncbi:Ail/Lom family outer membrane beta-barrel protein, partial [Escherichia coli]
MTAVPRLAVYDPTVQFEFWFSETKIADTSQVETRTNAPGSDNLNGINVKYRYEFTDTLGLVTSFSYAGDKNRQLTRY